MLNYYASDRQFILKFDLFTYKLSISTEKSPQAIALKFENGPIPWNRALLFKETNNVLKEP